MSREMRETGIDVIGAVPWGFHICMFYRTPQDLIDILAPYLKTGLENGEFCLFITSKTSDSEKTAEKLGALIAGFDKYLKKGQIEITDYTKFYFRNGRFNAEWIQNNMSDRLDKALASKYPGMRIFGETDWFRKAGWHNLIDYEKEVDIHMAKRNIMAVCAYPLAKCRIDEVLDIICNHKSALITDCGKWKFLRCFENYPMELEINKIKNLIPFLMEKKNGQRTGDFREILRTKIRTERKKRGLTQEEFARKAGISLNFLGQIERGTRTPSLAKLMKISDALDTDFKSFFSEIQYKPSERDKFTEKIMSVLETSSVPEKKLFYQVISFLSRKFGAQDWES